jgi:hypothetical protein
LKNDAAVQGKSFGIGRRPKRGWRLTLYLIVCWWAGTLAFGETPLTVTVSAPDGDYRDVPISITVPASRVPKGRVLQAGETLCQVEPAGRGEARLTWIAPRLQRGETRVYAFSPAKAPVAPGVELKRSGADLDFLVRGALFTRYDVTTGPNKPYFYPLNAPSGVSLVRRWPVENVPGETRDHPHHRGLWFTHGAVNGVDFWTEGAKTGKTVHRKYETTRSGPVFGLMRARTDWIAPDGKKIAEDERKVRVYNLPDGDLMDFAVTVKAVGGPLTWGDTKEGSFGLRLADSMTLPAGGHIVNSAGVKDGKAWGKPANWVDYYGPLAGETVGVAILDDPGNPRHPTTWHVRDYGLFAANPFGLHDFNPDLKNDPHIGDLTVPEGRTITFRYRLFFHSGTADDADLPAIWRGFANPPAAKLAAKKSEAGR